MFKSEIYKPLGLYCYFFLFGVHLRFSRRVNWMKISHVQNLHMWVLTKIKPMKQRCISLM